jgi:hypothetical protein
MAYGSLALDEISTSGNLAITGNVAATGNVTTTGFLQPSALRGTASATAPVFQDSVGTQIGTLCRAWVKITTGGTNPSVTAGFNVSSITYLSVGNWRVNFTNAMPTANYAGFVTLDGNWNITPSILSQTTTTANLIVRINSNGNGYNPDFLYVGFFA